jgi:hypothetical protein
MFFAALQVFREPLECLYKFVANLTHPLQLLLWPGVQQAASWLVIAPAVAAATFMRVRSCT